MTKQALGFTLIELMISVAILSILSVLAISSYSAVTSYWQAEETRTALYTGFISAKTQAFNAGRTTVICPSSDGLSCMNSTAWHHGWIIFQDNNKNREMDADDQQISTQNALPDGLHLTSTSGRTRLVFQANGSNGGTNVTFTLCDARGANKAKSLIISNSSRIRTAAADPLTAEYSCNSSS